jgi:hypothetical protein
MILFLPISYPLSLVLDAWLGHDEGVTTYSRMELRTMVRIQHEFIQKEARKRTASNVVGGRTDVESGRHSSNMDREISMIDAVLKFRDAVVKDAMTSDVFMLSMDDRFSFEVRLTGNDIFSSCKMFY